MVWFKTVISYISNEKTNFGVFIAHRVNKIRNSSKTEEWFYMPTTPPKLNQQLVIKDWRIWPIDKDGGLDQTSSTKNFSQKVLSQII